MTHTFAQPGRASRLTDLTMTNADLKEAVIAYGLFLFTEEDSVDKVKEDENKYFPVALVVEPVKYKSKHC